MPIPVPRCSRDEADAALRAQHVARRCNESQQSALLPDEWRAASAAARRSGSPIAPGWYGVANVKWLKRIEVRDTRFMGRFMARDYVTIREEQRNGETEAVETSVGRTLLKSAPAKSYAQRRPVPHRRRGLGCAHRARRGAG